MQNLLLDEGDLLNIESSSLPVATFSKFQPQSEDFLDISNPKAVLENALRNFACLTTGYKKFKCIFILCVLNKRKSVGLLTQEINICYARDVVAITYNDRVYELRVLETKPGNAVSIIECDMNVEFAPPVGYSEPTEHVAKHQEEDMDTLDPSSFIRETQGFVPFAGEGVR